MESPPSRVVPLTSDRADRKIPALARLAGVLERNAFTCAIVGVCVAAHAQLVRAGMATDAWFTVLAGRAIASSGLPHHDTLTTLTLGRVWVDQQWLAHLGFYELWRAGGWRLALLSVVALYGLTFTILAVTARRLGGSDRSVALMTILGFLAGFPNTALRAQIPAYVLFAAVLALVLLDERTPSRRIYIALPLLIVWANVHGSVILGAGLVTLRGLTLALSALRKRRELRGWALRAGALVVAPWLCILASPYGLALPGYYRRVLDNPTLSHAVSEWGPATIRNQPFFVVTLLLGVWLVGRSRAVLTPYSRLALIATGIAGLYALRNAVWFAFVAAAVLPLALDYSWPSGLATRRRGINLALGAGGVVAALASFAAVASHPSAWFSDSYPNGVVTAVTRADSSNPKILIFADERYADWLLFEDPSLAGRVAYDIRFELLTRTQLARIYAFRTENGPGWFKAIAGYSVLVLDPGGDAGAVQLLEHERGTVVLFANAEVVVLRRPQNRSQQ